MKEKIGFVGLGSMGLPMAGNLLNAGYELCVYNRTRTKANALISSGAVCAQTVENTAQPGGILFTMLSNDQVLEEIVLGNPKLISRLGNGGIHVSMSTLSPETSKKLAEHHSRHGVSYLAAPVFGRPQAAAAGKLWICLSGNEIAKRRVEPLLKILGQEVYDFGEEPEAANVVKLAGNFLIASAVEALGEALTLGEKNGIDRLRMAEMFSQSIFECPIYKIYGKVIAEERYVPPGFKMSLGYKDIRLLQETALQSRVPMPFASVLNDRLVAGLAKGREDMDWAAIAMEAKEDAGCNLRDQNDRV